VTVEAGWSPLEALEHDRLMRPGPVEGCRVSCTTQNGPEPVEGAGFFSRDGLLASLGQERPQQRSGCR
jgi:hypothetical protein